MRRALIVALRAAAFRFGPRTAGSVVAVALVAVLAGSATAGAPARSRNGWIVYSAPAPEAGGQIILAPLGPGRQRVLIRRLISAPPVTLSPNGRLIAFMLEGRGGPSVWLMRADGSGLRRLVRGSYPAWSPDGRRLAFFGAANRPGLMTIRRDGTGLRQVVNAKNSYPGAPPVWSAAGGRIAYMARHDQVAVVRADGKRPHRVAKLGPVSGPLAPFWLAPNGRRLAYVGGINGDIYTVSVNGGRPKRLTKTSDVDYAPQWSPDGTRIAFLRESVGTMVIRADGSAPARRVTGGINPSWSPDSSKLAVVRGRDVWVVRADGRAARRVNRAGGSFSEPAWAPGRWIALDGIELMSATGESGGRATQPPEYESDSQPDWAPDRRRFAFVRTVNLGCGQCDVDYLAVGELGSGSVRQTTTAVRSPSWSPDGSRIAAVEFGGGALVTMRPDGSDRRVVGVGLEDSIEIDWGPAR